MSLSEWIFPAERRHLPRGRWWNIAARTVHLAATGVLLGAHVFQVPAERLWPFLWAAIASGGTLMFLELYPSGHWLHQRCAVMVYIKLALLCLVPVLWDYRVPILLGVVILAAVGAHAPRTFRHYSFRFKRVMVD